MGKRISIMLKTKFLISILALFLSLATALQAVAQEQLPENQADDFEIRIPTGTVIPIVLTAYLNSRSSQVGDTVYADTTYPIWIQQRLAIPKGSTIRGTVTEVLRPGRIKGKARIAVRFDDILLPNGIKRDLVASFRGIHGSGEETVDRKSETVTAGGSGGTDAKTVAGTTSQGAIIGAIGGGGKGALAGGAIGSTAGLATVLFSRGKDLVLGPGTQFDLELQKEIIFSFNELEFSDSDLRNAQRQIRTTPTRTNNSRSPLNRRKTPVLGIPY
jgi:hypothetical protein